MFQSTPPCGGRPRARAGRWWILRFQSTPPCGGRLKPGWLQALLVPVSIHAPVRGATRPHLLHPDPRDVSIHAPVRGATLIFKERKYLQRFQSTPPCGGRLSSRFGCLFPHEVSIHAPVRGATPCPWPGPRQVHGFNPRPRAGGDLLRSLSSTDNDKFQSTPPCGGRPNPQRVAPHWWRFQSTPPCGGRQ